MTDRPHRHDTGATITNSPHNLTAGKIRCLQQLATAGGVFAMLALDHSDSMAELLDTDRATPDPATMVQAKVDLCRALAPAASAILLDPIYGAAQAVSQGALPGSCGLIVTLEDSGYEGRQWQLESKIIEGWSVRKIKLMGAQAVKLLVYYNPEDKPRAEHQRSVVRAAVEQCGQWDIPLLVEPIVYPVGYEEQVSGAFLEKRPRLIVETAQDMTALGIDILKAEFPANGGDSDAAALQAACAELDAASSVPWVILSAGVSYEQFRSQVEAACRAGASGFLAGRSLWAAAAKSRDEQSRTQALAEGERRLIELRELAESAAEPWYKRPGVQMSHVEYGWHRAYASE